MPKADGRRDNAPIELLQVLRTGSLPQTSLRDASSPIRWSRNWFAWERETANVRCTFAVPRCMSINSQWERETCPCRLCYLAIGDSYQPYSINSQWERETCITLAERIDN